VPPANAPATTLSPPSLPSFIEFVVIARVQYTSGGTLQAPQRPREGSTTGTARQRKKSTSVIPKRELLPPVNGIGEWHRSQSFGRAAAEGGGERERRSERLTSHDHRLSSSIAPALHSCDCDPDQVVVGG